MILIALYHMLKNKEKYNTELYNKSKFPPVERGTTGEQTINIAKNQSYKIKPAAA